MNTNVNSFNAGFKTVNALVSGTKAAGTGTAHAVISTVEAITSFFGGMHHAYRVQTGACKLLTHEVRNNEEAKS